MLGSKNEKNTDLKPQQERNLEVCNRSAPVSCHYFTDTGWFLIIFLILPIYLYVSLGTLIYYVESDVCSSRSVEYLGIFSSKETIDTVINLQKVNVSSKL